MAKLADVSDLGSDAVRHVGSSPITRTKKPFLRKGFFNLQMCKCANGQKVGPPTNIALRFMLYALSFQPTEWPYQ